MVEWKTCGRADGWTDSEVKVRHFMLLQFSGLFELPYLNDRGESFIPLSLQKKEKPNSFSLLSHLTPGEAARVAPRLAAVQKTSRPLPLQDEWAPC